jgi:hypothetical protein
MISTNHNTIQRYGNQVRIKILSQLKISKSLKLVSFMKNLLSKHMLSCSFATSRDEGGQKEFCYLTLFPWVHPYK